MASFEKLASGKTRAAIALRGVRKSKAFPTMAQARAWAASEEAKILAGEAGQFADNTLGEAIDRYMREVGPDMSDPRVAALRFAAFMREWPALVAKPLHQITADDLNAWVSARRAQVSDASVNREINQIRPIWTIAANSWKWCGASPWKGVRIPPEAPARTRVTGWREVRRILRACGYRTGRPPRGVTEQTGWAFLLALRTAMRAQEVRSLSRASVNLETRVARVDDHKTKRYTGAPRFVPLFPQAVRLLRVLDADAQAQGRETFLTLSAASLDALFRKVRDRLLIEDLHFHDSRAVALTHMARRVDVMTLAKISGHKDLRQLLDAYYRETPEQIAVRLQTARAA